MSLRRRTAGVLGWSVVLLLTSSWAVTSSWARGSAPADLHVALQRRWRDRLVATLAAGESVELARLGQQMGVGLLLAALRRGSERPLRRAALAAAPASAQAGALLPALLDTMQEGDRDESIAAGRAARRIAEGLRPRGLSLREESAATLRPLVSRAIALALDARRPLDVRVLAVLTAAALATYAPPSPATVARLLAHPDGALRRAAVELAAAAPELHRAALLERLGDTSAAVRRAAGAALCAALPARWAGGARARRHPLLNALRASGGHRALQACASDRAASRDELVDIGRCLRALGDATSQRAYRTLRRRVVRRRVARRNRR